MTKLYLGIDPGASGAFAIIDSEDRVVSYYRLDNPLSDIKGWIDRYKWDIKGACLEHVHAMPKQGVSSTFKFGASFGFCEGILVASGIPYVLVSPVKWQRHQSCLTKGDKNVTKNLAQSLWPKLSVNHHIADAFLLARYARLTNDSKELLTN